MTAAVVQVQVGHGANGSEVYTSAEAGVIYNRTDAEASTNPVPVPTTTAGSAYSNYKVAQLAVVTVGTTVISNIRAKLFAPAVAGMALFGKAVASYDQCTGSGPTAGNRPADTTTALAVSPHPNTPSTYNRLRDDSSYTIDAGSFSTASTGRKGSYLQYLFGVSQIYLGSTGVGVPAPTLVVVYDEA